MNTSFLKAGLAAIVVTAAAVLPAAALADYPDRPIRLLVGYPPGNATDTLARMVAEKLQQALGQPVVVENRPGQGGSVALATLSRAPADGYAMVFAATASLVTNPHLYPSVGYNTLKDFAPIGLIVEFPLILVSNPSEPFDSVSRFFARAKAAPGKLNYSSSGNGTLTHLAMELLMRDANIKVTHIPYPGSARALNDILGGSISVGFETLATTLPLIKAGRLRPLAVGSTARMSALPDVPTFSEAGVPGFAVSAWVGAVFPAGTAAPIVQRMNTEITKIVDSADVTQRLADMGGIPKRSSPADFSVMLRKEWSTWADVVRKSGAKID